MIYEKVLDYCSRKKIPLSDFEKKCGIGNGTIGKWKEHKASPTLRTLAKMEKYTGVAMSQWLRGDSK